MKTLYCTQIYSPKRIIISDDLLNRIQEWSAILERMKVKEDEKVECSISLSGIKYKEIDGVTHINSEYDPDSPVLTVERSYTKDDQATPMSDACYIEIYSGIATIFMVGEEGPDYMIDHRENLLTIPDVFRRFSKPFCSTFLL